MPYYEAWGWNLAEGGFWAKFNEYIANHYIFNTFITAQWSIYWDLIRHMILPAIVLGTGGSAIIARLTRASMLEVLGENHIRTARALVKDFRDRRLGAFTLEFPPDPTEAS